MLPETARSPDTAYYWACVLKDRGHPPAKQWLEGVFSQFRTLSSIAVAKALC